MKQQIPRNLIRGTPQSRETEPGEVASCCADTTEYYITAELVENGGFGDKLVATTPITRKRARKL